MLLLLIIFTCIASFFKGRNNETFSTSVHIFLRDQAFEAIIFFVSGSSSLFGFGCVTHFYRWF